MIYILASMALIFLVTSIVDAVTTKRGRDEAQRNLEREYCIQRLIKYQMGDKTYRSN